MNGITGGARGACLIPWGAARADCCARWATAAVWYRRAWQDAAFRAAAARRYQDLRGSVWTDAGIAATVRAKQAKLHDAAMRTFARWPVDMLNPFAGPQPSPEAQLQATVDKLLGWLSQRLAWFDGQFAAILAQAGDAPSAAAGTASTAG